MSDDLQPHQRRLVRKFQEPGRKGLVAWWGLGSGKTRGAIEVHKAIGGEADVVVPAALKANYRKELARWGGDPAKTNLVSQQAISGRGAAALKAPLLVTDEGHRARNPRSNLSAAIKGSPAQKRLVLSGTPIFNQPADLATVVNQAAGKSVLPEGKSFDRRFLKPGLIDRFRGNRISHAGQLKKVLNEYVDYHPGDPSKMPQVTARTIPVEMGKHQSALYRATLGRIPPGLKLHKEKIDKLAPYLTGARQVSNTSRAIDPASHEEPKLDRVFADLQKHLANPHGKALVYSNWLEHGIRPLQDRLTKAKIPHGIFTGNETPAVRDQHIRDYNAGKTRALLVSSSGSEGLDLKGTRLVQVVEPHFNNAKIRQVVGRSARMGSHENLPASERNVEVRQYIARPRRRIFGGASKGVEDLLSESARDKDETDRQIKRLLLRAIDNPLSRVKTILFALPGVMAAKYLHGTEWTKDPTGANQELLRAATAQRNPAGMRTQPDKSRWITRNVSGQPKLVPVRASDLRDETGYRAARKYGQIVDADKRTRGRLAAEPELRPKLIAGLRKRAEKSNEPVAKEIQSVRNAAASDLRINHAITIAARARSGVTPGGMVGNRIAVPDIIPGRMLNKQPRTNVGYRGMPASSAQHGEYQPHMIAPEMIAKARGHLERLIPQQQERAKVSAGHLYQNLHGRVKAALVAKTPDIQGRDIEKIVQNHLAPLQAPRTGLAAKHPPSYKPLAELLGKPEAQIERMHARMGDLRQPGGKEATGRITSRLIKSGRIFEDSPKIDIPKGPRTDLTHFPHLKRIGIAAGVIGGGLAISKLLKKKEEVREFAVTGEPYRKALRAAITMRTPAALGSSRRADLAMRLGESSTKAHKSIVVANAIENPNAWHPQHLQRVQDRSMLARDIRALKRTGKYQQRLINTDEQMREAALASAAQTRIEEAQKGHRPYFNKELRRIGDEHRQIEGSLITEHRAAEARIKTSARKKIAVGVGAGAVGGYAARRPQEETQFGVRDMLISAGSALTNGRFVAGLRINGAMRNLRRRSPSAHSIISGAAKGFATGLPGGTEIGAAIGAGKAIAAKIRQARPIEARVDATMKRIEAIKKQPIRMSDRSTTIQLNALDALLAKFRHKDDSSLSAHDVVTGGIEGGLGVLATDPLIHKLRTGEWRSPFQPGVGRNLAIGAGVGAVATGLVGAAINKLNRNKKQPVQTELSDDRKLIEFFVAPSRGAVTRDRYTKQIHERETERKESNYLRTGIAGAALGAALKGTGKAALIGAGAGFATQAAIRSATNEKDQFGEEAYAAKRIQKIPYQAGLLAAGVIAGRKGLKAIRPITKYFCAIELDALPKGYKIVREEQPKKRPPTEKSPLSWFMPSEKRWLGDKVNVGRRTADIRQSYNRAAGAIGDVKGLVTGEKAVDSRGRPRKREWEKPYVRHAIQGLILGGSILAGRKAIKMAQSPGIMHEVRDLFHSGTMRIAAERKIPGFKAVMDKFSSTKGEVTDEIHSIIHQSGKGGGLLRRAVDYIKKAGGDNPVPKAAMTKIDREAARAKEEGYKSAARLRKRAQGETELSAIEFDENTVYDDRWEAWLRHPDRPGFVPRNRRPKRWYEKEDVQRTVLRPAALGGAFVAGSAFGAFGGSVGKKIARKLEPIAMSSMERLQLLNSKLEAIVRLTN